MLRIYGLTHRCYYTSRKNSIATDAVGVEYEGGLRSRVDGWPQTLHVASSVKI